MSYELLWLAVDTQPVRVITTEAEAVNLARLGERLVCYVPNGTSVSPPRAQPWLDLSEPPRAPRPTAEPGDDEELTGESWYGESQPGDATSS